MKDTLKIFTATPDISTLDALKQIDLNKKGFLVIVEDSGKVLGTLTDGDIRRAFISGCTVNDPISKIYKKDFKSLKLSDGIPTATEAFKSHTIKFLPVLGNEGELVNLITKSQMHALLLQDINADLEYDFSRLDESIVDHEIYPRPWGFYKTTVMNDYCQSKIISVLPGGMLSLQSHTKREEHWIIAHGVGRVQLADSVLDVKEGSSLFIPKGCKHRLTNVSDKESLIVVEVQLGSYFGEDDIIRYEDIYNRI